MTTLAVRPDMPERDGPPHLDRENRVMPRTLNRGITCVVEVRRDLRRAMQALDVAIDIFDAPAPDGASHRTTVRDLTRLRDHLLDLQAELNRSWSASPWGG